MAIRETYSDSFTGEADSNIRAILGEKDSESNNSRLKKILIRVIKDELTEKQQKIVIMYYFRNMNTSEIAGQLGVTPQAVSAAMSRARLRIYKILKYYI